jgi:hypothetical protein
MGRPLKADPRLFRGRANYTASEWIEVCRRAAALGVTPSEYLHDAGLYYDDGSRPAVVRGDVGGGTRRGE